MIDLEFFLSHVFIDARLSDTTFTNDRDDDDLTPLMRRSLPTCHGDLATTYVSAFKTELDVYREFIRYVSVSVTEKSNTDLISFLNAMMQKYAEDVTFQNSVCLKYLQLLQPLMVVVKPSLSDVLSTSHYMCDDCVMPTCKNVAEWQKTNYETFCADVAFLALVIDSELIDYIDVNVQPFDVHKTKFFDCDDNDKTTRYRQLYTAVLYYIYKNR